MPFYPLAETKRWVLYWCRHSNTLCACKRDGKTQEIYSGNRARFHRLCNVCFGGLSEWLNHPCSVYFMVC